MSAHSGTSGRNLLLQAGGFVLPIVKCAVCPVCLSLFGGVFAGARLGLLGDERLHILVIMAAVVLDLLILKAAARHHKSVLPVWLCGTGGFLALMGHFTVETLEYAGFALLIVAAIANLVLLRRHRKHGGPCCAHELRGAKRQVVS